MFPNPSYKKKTWPRPQPKLKWSSPKQYNYDIVFTCNHDFRLVQNWCKEFCDSTASYYFSAVVVEILIWPRRLLLCYAEIAGHVLSQNYHRLLAELCVSDWEGCNSFSLEEEHFCSNAINVLVLSNPSYCSVDVNLVYWRTDDLAQLKAYWLLLE